MASLLEGQLAKAVFVGFRGKLLKGTLSRTVPGGALDSLGDPIAPTVLTFRCEGFVESFKADFRERAGIPDTDVSIMIFAESLNPRTTPKIDDRVIFRGTAYQIRKLLEIDPAVATFRCQGYKS